MDLISIVVAVYNAENTLEKCVNSLLLQTYKNTEIILVNDCSTDNSLKICYNYAQNNSNIIVINCEENVGVSAARNKGIKKSSGKYICFVDSDDYVVNNYIDRLYELSRKYNTVPICGFTFYDEYSHKKPVDYVWSSGNQLVSLGDAFRLYDECYLNALWNKMFRNDIIKTHTIKFDESLSMGEDLRFSLNYFEKAKLINVYVIAEPLYNYFKVNSNSLMSNFRVKGIDSALENLRLIKQLSEKFNNNITEIYEKKVSDLQDNFIYFITKSNKFSNAEKIERIKEFSPNFTKRDFRKVKYKILKEKIYTFIVK